MSSENPILPYVMLKLEFKSGIGEDSADLDGDMDLDDFVILKRNLTAAAIGEPTVLAILSVGCAGAVGSGDKVAADVDGGLDRRVTELRFDAVERHFSSHLSSRGCTMIGDHGPRRLISLLG